MIIVQYVYILIIIYNHIDYNLPNSVKHGNLLGTMKFLLVDHFLDSMSTIIQAHVQDFRMGSV
jgi:hypothetical protein